MGPPGSGKSTLGAELDRQGIAAYTELEPILVGLFGRGEEFARHRPRAHEWIWDYYRRELAENPLAVVMETTGISGRDFLEEVSAEHRVLLVRLNTPRSTCIARVRTRQKGRHVNDQGDDEAGEFFDYWHRDVAPTYHFDLEVSGMELIADTAAIRSRLR